MALQEQLPWLRLYVSVLNCPKVQRLPAPLFKHWINLLCVARSQDGILPGIADIAFALRIDVAEAETVVARLVDACLIDRTESGFMPHNWRIRQYRSDSSTERVRRHRLKRNVTETDEPEIGADSLKRYGNGLASISTRNNSLTRLGCFGGLATTQANWMISFLSPNQGIGVG